MAQPACPGQPDAAWLSRPGLARFGSKPAEPAQFSQLKHPGWSNKPVISECLVPKYRKVVVTHLQFAFQPNILTTTRIRQQRLIMLGNRISNVGIQHQGPLDINILITTGVPADSTREKKLPKRQTKMTYIWVKLLRSGSHCGILRILCKTSRKHELSALSAEWIPLLEPEDPVQTTRKT